MCCTDHVFLQNEESHFLSSEESPLELGVYVSAFGVSSQAIVLGRMDGAVNVLTHEGIMVHQWKNHKKEVFRRQKGFSLFTVTKKHFWLCCLRARTAVLGRQKRVK